MTNSKYQIPRDYSQSFILDQAVGNNAFSFDARKQIHTPKLTVPSLIQGNLQDIILGDEVVFEEYEGGELQSRTGLKNFVHTTKVGVDIYIFDNHNHALYFWSLHSRESGLGAEPSDIGVRTQKAPTLIHIDQHSDMRVPETNFEEYIASEKLSDLAYQEQVFRYTNYHLNIGNFIVPAQQMGIVGEVVQITGSIDDFQKPNGPYILDIDLDYFVSEMDFLPVEPRMQLIRDLVPGACVVTIASSPFFIDQEKAIRLLQEIF